jgi:hypothetical protein
MKYTFPKSISLFVLLGTFAVDPAVADHNSVWGAGTANMPNNIHNTRIELANTGLMTSDEWIAYVSKGAGADTVNTYLDTDGDGDIDADDEGGALPSQTSMNSGVVSADQVARGGRPDSIEPGVSTRGIDLVRPSPGPRAVFERPSSVTRTSVSIERPPVVSRARR